MKFKQAVDTQILSRLTMQDPNDFIARLRLHFDMLPSMTPEKWDDVEPMRRVYDPNYDWQEIYDWAGSITSISWKRTKKTRSWGDFGTACIRRPYANLDTHAEETIESELKQTNFDELIAYVKKSSVRFKADIACIEHWSETYRNEVLHQKQRKFDDLMNAPFLILTAHQLRYWLEDIFWVTVFGDAYVRLFGMEKLLSVPAYKVEKLNDETVFIQLTESIEDGITDFAEMQRVKQAVKEHLDPDAFFHLDKAFQIPDYPDEEFMRIGRSTVFNTPDFHLISDSYMDRNAE